MCIAAVLCIACVAAPAFAAPPIAELEARAAEEPHNPYWAYELALAYHAAHDLDRAIPQYRRALELDPTNSLVATSLHTALTERRMLHDAFTQFASGVTLPHQNAAASFNFGLVAEKQGLIEEAYFYYSRYIALAPNAPDAVSVQERLSAIKNAIMHRKVIITKLATSPARVKPGERAAAVFSYRVSGYGRHNSTGVIEQVSLFRDEQETHRFRQRAIRPSDRGYNTTVEFLVPDDVAPGVYTLVASVIAGSRRDDQIAVFPIDPAPIEIPEPITAEEWEAQQAAAAAVAAEDAPDVEQPEGADEVQPVDAQPLAPAALAPPPETSAAAAVQGEIDATPAQTEAVPPPPTEPSQPTAQEEPPTDVEAPAQAEQPAEKPAPAAESASDVTVEDLPPEQTAKDEPAATSDEEDSEKAPTSQPSDEEGDRESAAPTDESEAASPAAANVPG